MMVTWWGRLKRLGERLKYKMKEGKIGVLGLEKKRMASIVEVVEIAKLFVLLEVKVVEGMVKFDEWQCYALSPSLAYATNWTKGSKNHLYLKCMVEQSSCCFELLVGKIINS
ncbi:hypothetical protein J1N35_042090 [Gossypium stocksii]|uniref:Uncharacterized protein n=1 Tax=Gossypium stocksii TaxID=47602 RepID=A0A9D3ZJW8_9ROSI|nr:hypothetical protein J1N35_042090 [Gossypium stocksii]